MEMWKEVKASNFRLHLQPGHNRGFKSLQQEHMMGLFSRWSLRMYSRWFLLKEANARGSPQRAQDKYEPSQKLQRSLRSRYAHVGRFRKHFTHFFFVSFFFVKPPLRQAGHSNGV